MSTEKVKRENLTLTDNDFSEIEAAIKAGTFKVSTFADSRNANPVKVKEQITNHFGNKITFKRGRTGGVFWNN